MATLDLQVGAGADDAHEGDDGSNFNRTAANISCYAGTAASSRFNGGVRFTGLTIQGVTIDVAYLAIHALNTDYDDPECDILAEDVDNAVDFATTTDVTSRVRTTASVSWIATGIGTGEVNSPSIVTVAQELADRPSFADVGAVFLLDGHNAAPGYLIIDSYEADTTEAAKLHIEYTAGGADAVPQAWAQYRARRV